MTPIRLLLVSCCLLGVVALIVGGSRASAFTITAIQDAPASADKLVYADFENNVDNHPASSRGGQVNMFGYEENATLKAIFKGSKANPSVPDLVRTSKDNNNKALAFDYQLVGPNNWAGVTVEIHGQPDKDGKTVSDDVSGYKFLTLQAYATGVESLRVEFVSKGQGIMISNGNPEMVFRITPGFNTYKIPLKSISQPQYGEPRVSPKDVLKKLTSVNVSATCGPCTPISGTVVIDNLVFQN
ncbi:MAG TPA: hypothetical protein VKB46_18620 [Pyrinomonadaceae bacterium]|nr:hypothetical protein [Pyrinomonadaceae bacterium]